MTNPYRPTLLVTGFVVAGFLSGCWGAGNSGDADAGPYDAKIGASPRPFDPASFRVEGTVTIDMQPATDVRITGLCGDKRFTTRTDEEGQYVLETDVRGCTPLTVKYDKESYLPTMRVVHLPLKTSPIRLDIPIEELDELQCGSMHCTTWKAEIPPDPIAQGWITAMAGPGSLEYFPGEFRDTDGNLLSLLGFTYMNLKDAGGATIESMAPEMLCFEIDRDSWDWLGDVDPGTDGVEMRYYKLDEDSGGWRPMSGDAVVYFHLGDQYEKDEEGRCTYLRDDNGQYISHKVPLTRDQLGSARANDLYVADPCSFMDPPTMMKIVDYYMCFPIDGAGFYAWGIEVPHKTCFAAEVTDQCGSPVSGASFALTGRDHGYRAKTWTDLEGRACLEALASEPEGEDFDADGLGGETFWVDVTVEPFNWFGATIPDHENPRFPDGVADCGAPADCVQIHQVIDNFQICGE